MNGRAHWLLDFSAIPPYGGIILNISDPADRLAALERFYIPQYATLRELIPAEVEVVVVSKPPQLSRVIVIGSETDCLDLKKKFEEMRFATMIRQSA